MGTKYGKKYNYNLDIFYNEDDVSYYLLGVIMTDGCVKSKLNAITLSSNDLDWIQSIKNIICPDIKLTQNKKSYQFGIYSKELKEWLVSKGCVPRKSLTLQFPKLPEKYLPDFIRGCIDGDGSFGIYKNICRSKLCGSSLDFLTTYSEVLSAHDIKNYLFRACSRGSTSIINGKLLTRTSDHWRVDTAQKSTKKFISWIYYPNHKISMPRKKAISKTIIDFVPNPIGRKPNIVKRALAKELRNSGITLKEIAKQLKTSVSCVHGWTSS